MLFRTASDLMLEHPKYNGEDQRVVEYRPIVPPALLKSEIQPTQRAIETVIQGRRDVTSILNRTSDRLIVMVGPCSIHDPEAAVEYAMRLKQMSLKYAGELCIVMRAYLEKPRTTVGWKGLLNDPFLDSSYQINAGLRISRQLFVALTDCGLPIVTELLDTISPQYLSDLISAGAIGARTTESQLHRELASGVSFPVGFKNGTDGSVNIAMDAMQASASPHHFIGVSGDGLAAITCTAGNPDTFVILRGGSKGPNFDEESVNDTLGRLAMRKQRQMVMVDCSHSNSKKNFANQPKVARAVASQVAQGQVGICGLMIESNLNEGRQDIPSGGPGALRRGVSITDGCIGWETTVEILEILADAVKLRRAYPLKAITPPDSL